MEHARVLSPAPEAPTTTPDPDSLVAQHLPLVGHIVRETAARVPSHVDKDDLSSAGMIALVNASRAFDAERGIPFARYAATRIRGAIVDELRSLDWASRSVRRRGREIDAARASLAAAQRRVPDDAQIAEALGLTVAEVQQSADDLARASVLSLDVDTDQTFADVLPASEPTPDAQVEHLERLEYLDEAVQELPDRLRFVIRGYFLDERPMAELAEELGVTESRISQMRAEALVLLKDGMNASLEPELVAPHVRPDGCAARRRDAYFRAVAERHAANQGRPIVHHTALEGIA
ncbi:MAG TPA: FliA/WhiG family RNA polymerase sigma factor [Nocardioides bacterium]|uniref:sigma-70 family RNA polymerase sigma factor n=1 Tax=uncultured Nocardioides sp. TaxID=198441 RepID=UPI000EF1263F|nr:sigma-70 family RNA polymerase sigma factor [uncultured Nocardioides sp.]HCB03999.1 FliA/WhiG family RNA polymerase sigma factor [Nocardioides sp.]